MLNEVLKTAITLNLKQLGGGSSRDISSFSFAHELDLSGVKAWGEHPFLRPVYVTGAVEYRFEVFTLSYTARFHTTGVCSRCLAPVEKDREDSFSHTVLIREQDESFDNSFISAAGGELELDGLVISDLLLKHSGVNLCGEDCRGLCPKCGKNLNEGDCGCIFETRGTGFDVLRKFINEENNRSDTGGKV